MGVTSQLFVDCTKMKFVPNCFRTTILLLAVVATSKSKDSSTAASSDDYNLQHNDGSYEFGYDTPDHFHHADGTRDNFVRGQFGSRNPGTGAIDTISYTAGPRGFRPRGKNVHRKYDLNQIGPLPIGSKDDPYFDPNEDPSYNFSFRTRTYNRQEAANRVGDVSGRYSYLDDVGERHNVEYIAGKNTGFHVKTPYPDSNPAAIGPLYFQGIGKPPRGRTSIQRGLDGSYRFVSAGPDQRRTETSDASGHVRGSYTFIDDKGLQHTVHYIAGPETGYRVLKNVKGPHFPNWYPFGLGRPGYPIPDFSEDYVDTKNEDIFKNPNENLNTAASGHNKPSKAHTYGPSSSGSFDTNTGSSDFDDKSWEKGDDHNSRHTPKKPSYYRPNVPKKPLNDKTKNKPFLSDNGGFSSSAKDDDDFSDDLFSPSASGDSIKPFKDLLTTQLTPLHQETNKPTISTLFEDDTSKSTSDQDDLFGNRKSFTAQKGNKNGNFGTTSTDYSTNTQKPVFNGNQDTEEPVHLGATFDEKGTILKNIGNKFISFPPGVAVRAHVQSIDILPYGVRLPSPSDQLKSETINTTEKQIEDS